MGVSEEESYSVKLTKIECYKALKISFNIKSVPMEKDVKRTKLCWTIGQLLIRDCERFVFTVG